MAWVTLGTAALLLIPVIAMRFTAEVAWTASDFVVAGGLLLGTGTMYALASSMTRSNNRRALIGVLLVAMLTLVWIELAVGIFD
jgi:hypothetical protein